MRKQFILIALILFIGIYTTNASAVYFNEDNQYLYLGNNNIELIFQKSDGKLYGIKHKATDTDFIKVKNAWWSLYTFSFYTGTNINYVGGYSANSFSYSSRDTTDGMALELSWNGFTVNSNSLNILVDVTIEIKNESSLSYWTIDITNNENITIEAVIFPDINGLGQISTDPDQDYLVYPSMSGFLFENPLGNFVQNRGWGWELYYPSAYSTMQFMAYYGLDPSAGLYFASYDPDGNNKFFNIAKPDHSWMNAQIHHIPEFISGANYNMEYPTVVGVFSGDWYDAANIYRSWAINQWWCDKGTTYQRTDIPSLYKEMASMLIILTHLRTVNVENDGTVPEIVKAATDYLNIPVLVSWWGWEKDGWYENYPEVFPPYKGWESFDDTVNGMHQNQGYFFACLCTDFYSMDIPSWDNAKEYAIKNKDGSYVVIKMTPPLVTTYALMDPSTKFFQDTILNMSMTLINHGVDFLWMDGFPIVLPHLCYNTEHSHPIGGGNWWFLGYKKMFENIRMQAKEVNPNFAMGAEGMAEVYLPYFDSFYDPTIPGISPYSFSEVLNDINKVYFIPLWDIVYHDYLISYSTHSFITPTGYKSYRDFYTWSLGMNLVRGKILKVWANGKNFVREDPNMADYYKRAVEARFLYASQFLIYGQKIRSPEINVPTFHIPETQDIPYTLDTYPAFDSPSVLSSLWKAPNGSAGYVFTNISHGSVSFDLYIDHETTELSSGQPYMLYEIRNGVISLIDSNRYLPQTINITINSLDVVILIVSSEEISTTSSSSSSTSSTTTITNEEKCKIKVLYGEESEETKLLRDFRDNVLSKTPEGQEIIRLYYQWSPVIIEAIEGDEGFKQQVKEMIDAVLPLISGEIE